MKTFFRDYVTLVKASFGFMRKHWLGMTILTILAYIIGAIATLIYMIGWKPTITLAAETFKFKKKEEEDDIDEELKDILGE